jgi:hypothetical protein
MSSISIACSQPTSAGSVCSVLVKNDLPDLIGGLMDTFPQNPLGSP